MHRILTDVMSVVSVSVSLCQISVTEALLSIALIRTLTFNHALCKCICTLTENKQVRCLVFVFQNRDQFVFYEEFAFERVIWLWPVNNILSCGSLSENNETHFIFILFFYLTWFTSKVEYWTINNSWRSIHNSVSEAA